MNFKEKLNHWQNQVNQSLDEFLPGSGEHPAQLHQAIRYSVHAGGKRLRPILVLAAHELYPGELDPIPAAMAMECIHTYSLIHDDLPAMDDSDLRRGNRPVTKNLMMPRRSWPEMPCNPWRLNA